MRRRTRWGPFSSGVVYQVVLVGGLALVLFGAGYAPLWIAAAIMVCLEVTNRWAGPLVPEAETCETSQRS